MKQFIWYLLFAIMVCLVGCGDNGSTTTTSTATTMTSTPMTGGPSSTGGSEETGPEATSTPTGGTSAATNEVTTAMETTGAVAGAPVFLSFNTNAKKLTDGESIIFTAILTDPDGFDDIAGGSLRSEDEAIDFGPFVAAGQEGTYSISLSWAQIHQADPIKFESGELPRVFQARFFDTMGHQVVKTTEISLYCAGGGVCDGDGACKDFGVDGVNCGACGRVCDAGVDGCMGGECEPSWGPCIVPTDNLDTCDLACGSIQETCVESACELGGTLLYFGGTMDCQKFENGDYSDQPCSEPQPWGPEWKAVKCCCTDTK